MPYPDPRRAGGRWVLLVFLVAAAALIGIRYHVHETPAPAGPTDRSLQANPQLAAQVAHIESTEQRMNETIWASETLAQDCGRTVESWWDSLNAASNKLDRVASFDPGELLVPAWNPPQPLRHGIILRTPKKEALPLSSGEWKQQLESLAQAGWRLIRTEIRHVQFDTNPDGSPWQSLFQLTAQLTNALSPSRATLDGPVRVDWSTDRSADGLIRIRRIDASQLALSSRSDPPLFTPWLEESLLPPANSDSIDPLIVHDLDGDGRPEIILAGLNRLYRLNPEGGFQSAPLCRQFPGPIRTAMIADFDTDGGADFLCLKLDGLFLLTGDEKGSFAGPGRLVWTAPPELRLPMALTCGDIDGDGDLDLFLGQYKQPYESGSMPTPYHDANDGSPCYLLLNDGKGVFVDVTKGSGLEPKRHRRTYSASLVDLDREGKPDLVVISDFAGVDLYRNLGGGRFEDVTAGWLVEREAFGMAHALADFNEDGWLDLLVIGMHSPTVDRLEHLGLWRPDSRLLREMRPRMAHGNRLLLAQPDGFRQSRSNPTIARTGWSWGCTAADFDNDGLPDVYVANGMESRQSVRDYESEFWLHDIYVAGSQEDPAAHLYFKAKLGRTQGMGQSYGGYDLNRLLLNGENEVFREIGHLAGVSTADDSRCVVGQDLDGDGRVDLAVTGYETWPRPKQTLRVFRNTISESGNWIGFRLHEKPGRPVVGTTISISWQGGSSVRSLVTGDSHRSQHGATLHFGLGGASTIESAEIRWPSGLKTQLKSPGINQYHKLHPAD